MMERKKAIKNVSNPIFLLDDYLNSIEDNKESYAGVQIFFSLINQNNLDTPQMLVVKETLSTILSSKRGRIFYMPNGDTFIIFSKKVSDDIEAVLMKLLFIFSKDPLIEKYGKNKFYNRYDFATDFKKIFTIINDIATGKNPVISHHTNGHYNEKIIDTFEETKSRFLTLKEMAQIENNISNTDFSNMMRKRPICIVIGNSTPQILFEEISISMTDLKNILFPGISFNFEPNLFHCLSETIDKRLLASINRHDDGFLSKNFGLKLNIKTVLSDDFLRFDEHILSSLKSTIVIGLNLSDIFSEIGTYIMARNFLYEQGYKICLTDVKHEELPFINIEGLGLDFVKIHCCDALTSHYQQDVLKSEIHRLGRDKIILTHIDSEGELQLGQQMGVMLFQGKFIQNKLSSSNPQIPHKW